MSPKAGPPGPSEIAPERVWHARRRLVAAAGAWLGGAGLPSAAAAAGSTAPVEAAEPPSSWDQITRHNNYYEFSPAKDAVWKLAEEFNPLPWTLTVEGEVDRPRTWGLDELLARFAQEDRVERLRCVEGWSIVVPWRGFALAPLLALAAPRSAAKFVEFVSVHRPSEMIGQRRPVLPWPYREGLRIDEAMHPLTLLASGLYGKALPAQNGAPLRLVVPWKYGFKSAKAITRIRLVEQPPATSWMQASPSEYGFYANVNPEVTHPRWSQRREHRLGEMSKRATLPFNGYAAQVASLYAGMDLARHF
jgi:methionine sulfoxide reductase catalytic subunit